MKTVKKLFSQIIVYLTFLVLSTLLWGWLFTLKTDAPPAEKITVYIDCAQVRDKELAAALEQDLPGNIRTVKVHTFSYAFFDSDALEGADLFIVPRSKADGYRDSFAAAAFSGTDALTLENGAVGQKIYNAETGTGGASSYIAYLNEAGEAEDFYLFFGAVSLHFAGNENAVDNAAAEVAQRLLTMDEGE